MAEINTAAEIPKIIGTAKAGVPKSKKLSTKVDLTPMVDLGFLLITFFIITTKLSEPKTEELKMPADGKHTEICESCALTVIPNGDGKIFYYHGNLENAMRTGDYGITNYDYNNGIGQIIREKRNALPAKGMKKEDFMLLIKPMEGATYGEVVDLFDEVLINVVTRYAIVSLADSEKEVLKTKKL